MNQNSYDEGREDFQMTNVCSALKYDVTIFGMKVNVWVLLLVIAVVVGLVMTNESRTSILPTTSELSLSSTSSMATIAEQMGGFMRSLSTETPAFIRNLH